MSCSGLAHTHTCLGCCWAASTTATSLSSSSSRLLPLGGGEGLLVVVVGDPETALTVVTAVALMKWIMLVEAPVTRLVALITACWFAVENGILHNSGFWSQLVQV